MRPFLSRNELFSEPYMDTPFEVLQTRYRLDVNPRHAYYTPRELLSHYKLEVELARRLKDASARERLTLYSAVYDELFRRLPYHPQNRKKQAAAPVDLAPLLKYVKPGSTFLELGAGDCRLSFAMSKHVKKVIAIDVSNAITDYEETPSNFELILSNGTSIDVPEGSIDLAYSNQLMEHLHPDDAGTQLREIHKALIPGGLYLCITPHRFGGPADISKYFDNEATGFHLKEYTNSELYTLFKSCGFGKLWRHDRRTGLPLWPSMLTESVIGRLPYDQRKRLYRRLKWLLGIRLVAQK